MPPLAAFCKGRLLTTQNPREESVCGGEWRLKPMMQKVFGENLKAPEVTLVF